MTPDDIASAIKEAHYFTGAQGLIGLASEVAAGQYAEGEARPVKTVYVPREMAVLTFCVLRLRNGFTVVGHSAPEDEGDFNAETGRKIAYENALRQLMPMLAFLRRETAVRQDVVAAQIEALQQIGQSPLQ